MGMWPFNRDDSGDDGSRRYADITGYGDGYRMSQTKVDPAKKLRLYEVRLKDGTTETIEAHFAFDNSDDGRGLVFRRDVGEEKTIIAMQYANGSWISFREIR